ncbi:MAG TPA: hypothetical protein VGS79_17900 [Puia sp.]|nr:hypothetical protein [Puia sp.]
MTTNADAGSGSLRDAYGCQVTIPTFTIRQIPMPAFDYGPLQQNDDTCN